MYANPVNFVFVWVPVNRDKVVKVQEPLFIWAFPTLSLLSVKYNLIKRLNGIPFAFLMISSDYKQFQRCIKARTSGVFQGLLTKMNHSTYLGHKGLNLFCSNLKTQF